MGALAHSQLRYSAKTLQARLPGRSKPPQPSRTHMNLLIMARITMYSEHTRAGTLCCQQRGTLESVRAPVVTLIRPPSTQKDYAQALQCRSTNLSTAGSCKNILSCRCTNRAPVRERHPYEGVDRRTRLGTQAQQQETPALLFAVKTLQQLGCGRTGRGPRRGRAGAEPRAPSRLPRAYPRPPRA